jgi:hypothetical protein
MDRWNKLYERFVSLDQQRRERQRAETARLEAIRAFDAWGSHAVDTVMRETHIAMSARARDFAHHTCSPIELSYPARPPIAAPPDGPFMTFLTINVAHSHVHLYSHRLSMTWPLLHMILVAGDPRGGPPSLRNRTLVTMPGCMILQGANRTPELRRVCPADPHFDRQVTSVDEIVFRCFDMVVDGLRRAA